jgi:hypothetical protein
VAANAATGARDVKVTNPDGGSATRTGGFTVTAAPTVSSVTPSSRGQGATSQSLTIAGTNFASGATVTFSGTGITVNSVTRNSSTSLTVNVSVASNAATGARDVTVKNPDAGVATLTGGFAVNPSPTLLLITPNFQRHGTTQTVTITGNGFVSGATVTFSGNRVTAGATTVGIGGTTLTFSVTVQSNANTSTRNVTVTNGDHGTKTLANAYRIT